MSEREQKILEGAAKIILNSDVWHVFVIDRALWAGYDMRLRPSVTTSIELSNYDVERASKELLCAKIHRELRRAQHDQLDMLAQSIGLPKYDRVSLIGKCAYCGAPYSEKP